MTLINNYFNDGANNQAQAVLCLVKYLFGDGIEESWNKNSHRYDAEVKVSRWENCREQGYVFILRSKDHKKQLNIAVFEHRNSDDICAVKWIQNTINAPTIDNAKFSDVYIDKWDVSHFVSVYQIFEMAKWINDELNSFWMENT